MKQLLAVVTLVMASASAHAPVAMDAATRNPRNPAVEITTLNLTTDQSRFDVLDSVANDEVYDLAVELFLGTPTTCCADRFGDPISPAEPPAIPLRRND